MAVKIRLVKTGGKGKPIFRIVVADNDAPQNGKFIQIIGQYDPAKGMESAKLNAEVYKAWIGKGATPSETVSNIAKKLNL